MDSPTTGITGATPSSTPPQKLHPLPHQFVTLESTLQKTTQNSLRPHLALTPDTPSSIGSQFGCVTVTRKYCITPEVCSQTSGGVRSSQGPTPGVPTQELLEHLGKS